MLARVASRTCTHLWPHIAAHLPAEDVHRRHAQVQRAEQLHQRLGRGGVGLLSVSEQQIELLHSEEVGEQKTSEAQGGAIRQR